MLWFRTLPLSIYGFAANPSSRELYGSPIDRHPSAETKASYGADSMVRLVMQVVVSLSVMLTAIYLMV
jgi:hypothetical protein